MREHASAKSREPDERRRIPAMIRRNLLAIALLYTLFGPVPFVAAEPVSNLGKRVLKKLPIPLVVDVWELIEALTTRRTTPTVKTIIDGVRGSSELKVYQVDFTITVEGEDSSWLGANRVKIKIPCKVRYFTDLSQLRKEDIRFDAARRLVIVRMPPVQMEEPIPDREAQEIEVDTNPWLRSRSSWLELRDQAIAEQLKPRARDDGEKKLQEATYIGRKKLEDFLQKMYAPMLPDIKVFVD